MRFLSMASLVMALMVSACASQAGHRQDFSATSPDALVAIGIKSNVGPYGISFGRLNPETCQLNPLDFGKAFSHNTPFSPTAWKASGHHYILATFKPGTWVISNVSYDAGITRSVQYTSGTLTFTAKPGEFIYLGDISLEKRGFKFTGYDHAALRAHLADFPNVTLSPVDHPRWIAPFAEGGPVPDCNRPRY